MSRKKPKEGIRIKITKDRVVFLAMTIIFAVFVYYIIVNFYKPPINTWGVNGQTVGFRADLREANKVLVYPNEGILYYELINPLVQNVTIAYKPGNEKENALYLVNVIETINKLTFKYKTRFDYVPNFNELVPIESYENLPGKIQNPIIVFVPPSYSNETAIRLEEGHVIFIKAKNYKDFDLATVKLLMVVLGIELRE